MEAKVFRFGRHIFRKFVSNSIMHSGLMFMPCSSMKSYWRNPRYFLQTSFFGEDLIHFICTIFIRQISECMTSAV
ncbi:Membrane glycoprotein US8 [Dirofilaria immitis]